GTANIVGRLRLEIEAVNVAGAAVLDDEDAGLLGVATGLVGDRCARLEKLRQPQAEDADAAHLQEAATVAAMVHRPPSVPVLPMGFSVSTTNLASPGGLRRSARLLARRSARLLPTGEIQGGLIAEHDTAVLLEAAKYRAQIAHILLAAEGIARRVG